MKFSAFILMILLLSPDYSRGQNSSFNAISEGDFYFNFKNLNFVKNNEYSNPITEGYTLIGYFIHPEFILYPDEKVTLQLGAHLLSYSGTNRFTIIKPSFSTTWHFNSDSYFRIGSLSGSDEHRMFDPHFSKERIYTNYQEDGLQLRILKDRIFNDTWLSWENYIFKGDTDREIFTAGESFRYISPQIASCLRFELPAQIQFKHFGGQISNYSEHVETYLNLAAGVRLSIGFKGPDSGIAGVESLFFTGSSLTDNAPSGIRKGNAEWYKLFYSFRKAEINAGFWTSHNYYAPNGNFIFGSVSDHYDDVVVSDRKLITCSAMLNIPYRNFLQFYFAIDGYYDTDLKRFDNALTLHLKLNNLIRIGSVRN
jgi:hypothetical protein